MHQLLLLMPPHLLLLRKPPWKLLLLPAMGQMLLKPQLPPQPLLQRATRLRRMFSPQAAKTELRDAIEVSICRSHAGVHQTGDHACHWHPSVQSSSTPDAMGLSVLQRWQHSASCSDHKQTSQQSLSGQGVPSER